MKIWTTTVDCVCGKKHSFCTNSDKIPLGQYVYRCHSLKVTMNAGMQAWSECDKVSKGIKKINFIQ